MAKKLALVLAVLMLVIVVWGLFFENNAVSIVINGQKITGPFKGVIGTGGLVVALVALVCVAILLMFVFAGTSILIVGFLILGGVMMVGIAFPFLLPLFIPLAIVWGFIALIRHKV